MTELPVLIEEVQDIVLDTIGELHDAVSRRIFANAIVRSLEGYSSIVAELLESDIDIGMTNEEAMKFEQTELRFGKHRGEKVIQVPFKYLIWLAEPGFTDQLRRYLKRPDIQEKIERETE